MEKKERPSVFTEGFEDGADVNSSSRLFLFWGQQLKDPAAEMTEEHDCQRAQIGELANFASRPRRQMDRRTVVHCHTEL